MLKVGLVQFSPSTEAADNVARILHYLQEEKNSLFVLPELFLGDYFQPIFLTPVQLKQELAPLIELSRVNQLTLVGSIALKKHGMKRNALVVVSGGQFKINGYFKKKLFKQERDYFTPGRAALGLAQFQNFKLAAMICFDIINPVSLATVTAQNQIDFLTVTASVSVDYLLTISKARSIENQVFTIFANRSRDDQANIKFLGNSSIFYPDGNSVSLDESYQGVLKIAISEADIKQMRATRKFLGIYERDRNKKSRTPKGKS